MSIQRLVSVNMLLAVLSILCFAQNAQATAVHWRANLNDAKIEAGRTGKPLLLHFYSSNCGPCKMLDRDVFSQPQIATAMERDYIPVKINTEISPALAKAYGISKVPTEIILSSQGKPLQKLSCPIDAQKYEMQLANVAQYYRQQPTSRRATSQAPMHSAYAGLNINRNRNVLPVATQSPASKQPVIPVVTTNPYINAAPTPAARPARPQTPIAQTPVPQPAVQNLAAQQTLMVPANAMPNSYRNQYAAASSTPATPAPAIAPVATVPAAAATSAVQQATANAPVATKKTWPPELPASAPPHAFDGYCPVSLKETQKWVRGKQAFGAIHRNQTFLFASKRQQQQFLVSPDAYSPVFSGNDPVKMLDENIKMLGKRQFGCKHRGAFYLFSSKETMERFISQPNKYSTAVRQAMERMDATTGTLRR